MESYLYALLSFLLAALIYAQDDDPDFEKVFRCLLAEAAAVAPNEIREAHSCE